MAKCINGRCYNEGVPEFDGECAYCHDHNNWEDYRQRTSWAVKPKGVTRKKGGFLDFADADERDKPKDNGGGGGFFGW